MVLKSRKISTRRDGYHLYSVTNTTNQKITIQLRHSVTPFGLESMRDLNGFKWTVQPRELIEIREIETQLLEHFQRLFPQLTLRSRIDRRLLSMPVMLECVVEGESEPVVKHEEGELILFSDIKPQQKAHVRLEIKSVSVSPECVLYYKLIVKEILLLKDLDAVGDQR